MKRLIDLLMITVLLVGCSAPKEALLTTPAQTQQLNSNVPTAWPATLSHDDLNTLIAEEMKASFDYFWEQANTNLDSQGYGLIRDRYPGSEGISSLAATGFGLTAYLIGIEKGYISYQDGYDRVNGTLQTLAHLEREHGFYQLFLDQNSGKRVWDSEFSSLDTSILMMGVLSVGQYFGGEIMTKAMQIFNDIDWPWFLDNAKDTFYMAYWPESSFGQWHWDFYAEHLMMYILAAGSATHPVDDTPYYTFTRHVAAYDNSEPFIHSWFGSLFTYQYSHAWIDFKNYADKEGVNWFDNSVKACKSQYQFAIDFDRQYQTLGPDAWGLSASDGPNGYNGRYGAPPSGLDDTQNEIDDTVAPYAAIGCIIFTPGPSMQALKNYSTIEELKGKYGFYDAFNLTENWIDSDVIGVDKGITLLMLANAENDFVHRIMMQNEVILNGLSKLGLAKTE